MSFQNAQFFMDAEDPIFGGENSGMNFNEEPIGAPDQQPETLNTVSPSLSSLLDTRKRKGSDSHEIEQDRPVSKKRCFEDGYPNKSKGLRWIFIFNYLIFQNSVKEERKGSESDVSSLDTTFTKLGFEIVLNENLSYKETFSQLTKIQQMCNDGGTHMIVLVFMSHGDERDPDNFLTSDGHSVSMSLVRNMFSSGNCEGLRGKPKIFLGIFCRSFVANHEDVPQSSPATRPERSQSDSHPMENDEAECDLEIEEDRMSSFLNSFNDHTSIMESDGRFCSGSPWFLKPDDLEDMTTIYSSQPGTVSYRHPRNGSVMVQCLCRVLEKDGETHHLNDLYRLLQREMKAEQTGASSEYSFSPDRDDLELKTCFFADL